MKTAKISGVKYPVLLLDSAGKLDPAANAVQCLQGKNGRIQAFFYDGSRWFSAVEESSVAASVKIAAMVEQYIQDCKVVCVIDGVSFPTRHRSVLYAQAANTEKEAPSEVIHWWLAGSDESPLYKCDIHFEVVGSDFITLEGSGSSLAEALQELTTQCIDYGFGVAGNGDRLPICSTDKD